jgi:hypothetical protein
MWAKSMEQIDRIIALVQYIIWQNKVAVFNYRFMSKNPRRVVKHSVILYDVLLLYSKI